MSISDYALITLPEAREYPGMPSSGNDSIIEGLIDGCSLDIEQYCNGKIFVQRALTEDYTWDQIKQQSRNNNAIWLRKLPIVSVASITDPASNTVDSDDYWIDKVHGCLRTTGQWVIPQDSNGFAAYWTIVYTAGLFENTLAIPGNVKMACRIYVAQIFRHPDPDVIEKAVGDLKIKYNEARKMEVDFMIPARVRSLIGSYKSFEL